MGETVVREVDQRGSSIQGASSILTLPRRVSRAAVLMVTASGPPVPVISSGLPALVAVTSTELSAPEPLFRVVTVGDGTKGLVSVPSTVNVLPPEPPLTVRLLGVGVGVVDRGGRQAGDAAGRAVVGEQRGLAGRVLRVVEGQSGEANGVCRR